MRSTKQPLAMTFRTISGRGLRGGGSHRRHAVISSRPAHSSSPKSNVSTAKPFARRQAMGETMELLPCPLCHCAVELVLDHTVEEIDWIRHKDERCGVEFSGPRGQVVEAWNRRPAPLPAPVETRRD